MKAGFAIVLTLMLAATACSNTTDTVDDGGDAGPLKVRPGVNDPDDPNIAVLEFLPSAFTVDVGAEVEWSFAGPEPHSVTFLPEGKTPPAPNEAGEFFLGETTGTVDGTALANSGLLPLGPTPAEPFTATFPEAGEFDFVCVIHPTMTGTVTVVEESADADTQAEVDSRAQDELDGYLAEGRAAKTELVDTEPRQEGDTWYVETGVTTEHTDVLAFAPTPATVKPGDTVVFVNNSGAPHTVTFGPNPPLDPESEEAVTPSGTAPLTLKAGKDINSGLLPPNAPPGAVPEVVRSFAFVVPEGTFSYICVFHVPSGMTGTIEAG